MADTTDNQAFHAALEHEPGLFRQVGDLFLGPMGRWAIVVYLMGIAATALTAWLVVHMFEATTDRELILWSAAALATWGTILMIKLWVWGRLNTLTVLRAIKQMENSLRK